ALVALAGSDDGPTIVVGEERAPEHRVRLLAAEGELRAQRALAQRQGDSLVDAAEDEVLPGDIAPHAREGAGADELVRGARGALERVRDDERRQHDGDATLARERTTRQRATTTSRRVGSEPCAVTVPTSGQRTYRAGGPPARAVDRESRESRVSEST